MFKKHYMLRLPKNIFDHLLQKEVTPEFSTMEFILHHVRKVEEIAFQMSQYWNERRSRQALNNEAKDFAAQRSYGKGDATRNLSGNNKFQKKFERKDDR